MLVKLASPQFSGAPVDKATIKKMVDYYRTNRRKDSNSLKFAHFPLTELIQFLIDNSVISGLLPQDQPRVRSYGIKLYAANHANDPTTCPGGNPAYIDKDTFVACLTQLVPEGSYQTWTDVLSDGVVVGVPGGYMGMGLDKSTICPPDCPTGTTPYTSDISNIQ